MCSESVRTERGRHFIEQNRFVKEFSADVPVEYEKAIRIYDISEQSSLFEAPRPLSSNQISSRIEFELMADPVLSIREVFKEYLKSAQENICAKTTFKNVGRSLALIHGKLNLSTSSQWCPPVDLRDDFGAEAFSKLTTALSDSENVALHGDFGFSNVYIKKDELLQGKVLLWIVDPSPNFFMTFKADNVGPAEIDLGNLVACMHGLIPIRDQFACNWRFVADLFENLMAGYESVSNRKVDRKLLSQIVDLTLLAYLRQRISNDCLRRIALSMLYRRRQHVGY